MGKKFGSKVAIIGAGAVGSTIAFTMAIQQLCTELVLIDVNQDKAKGEALDISHGLPFLGQMDLYAGDYSDVKDCDLIIITAGIPRKPGESRLDLAKKNVMLGKNHGERNGKLHKRKHSCSIKSLRHPYLYGNNVVRTSPQPRSWFRYGS